MSKSTQATVTEAMPNSSVLAKPKPKAKASLPAIKGAAAVTRALEAFSFLPLHALAACNNQSIRSYLRDATGLSKARIAKGNLDRVRPSTLKEIAAHQQRRMEESFNKDPETLEHVQRQTVSMPRTRSGHHAPLAGWVHEFEFLTEASLSISKAVALEMDELVEDLMSASRLGSLAGFRQTVRRHLDRHGVTVRVDDESPLMPVLPEELTLLREAKTWGQMGKLTNYLLDNLYLDLISTFDAEWGSQYFLNFVPAPVFPLVMVRPQAGLIETMKVTSKRNIIKRPSRRLLELLFALAHYSRLRKWPTRAPLPKVIGDVLDQPGKQEMSEASLISNYFDGTSHLTLDLVSSQWDRMLANIGRDRGEAKQPSLPLPIVVLALQWQELLVRDKERSFFLLDTAKYHTLWLLRRQQWVGLNAERVASDRPAGQSTQGLIEWPAWLLNQSSSSSA